MQEISSEKAPKAVGPYSQAIASNGFVFCSGQIGLNPETGLLVEGGVSEQATQVIKNLEAVLFQAGSSLSKVVKCEVYLADISDYNKVNEVYENFFTSKPLPARVALEVSKLPKDALVEISCIAII
jgi:2-iminobutanoate/2-iminopropanoate deaminase